MSKPKLANCVSAAKGLEDCSISNDQRGFAKTFSVGKALLDICSTWVGGDRIFLQIVL